MTVENRTYTRPCGAYRGIPLANRVFALDALLHIPFSPGQRTTLIFVLTGQEKAV